MFGSIGVSELVLILMIAVVIFGPRRLSDSGGNWGERSTSSSVRAAVSKKPWGMK